MPPPVRARSLFCSGRYTRILFYGYFLQKAIAKLQKSENNRVHLANSCILRQFDLDFSQPAASSIWLFKTTMLLFQNTLAVWFARPGAPSPRRGGIQAQPGPVHPVDPSAGVGAPQQEFQVHPRGSSRSLGFRDRISIVGRFLLTVFCKNATLGGVFAVCVSFLPFGCRWARIRAWP